MKPIVILGAGEQGRCAKNIFELSSNRKISFLDDRSRESNVIGPLAALKELSPTQYDFFVAFGDNTLRKNLFLMLMSQQKKCVNAIHPTAYLEKSVRLGTNVMVGAFVYLNIDTVVGDNVIINSGSIIEHDNFICSHSQLGPGVTTAGRVYIGEKVFVGTGSIIIDHCRICDEVTLGGGAVVIESIVSPGLYVGIPAKERIKR